MPDLFDDLWDPRETTELIMDAERYADRVCSPVDEREASADNAAAGTVCALVAIARTLSDLRDVALALARQQATRP